LEKSCLKKSLRNPATAKSVEEALKLIEVGFEYVCDLDEVKLFKKRK